MRTPQLLILPLVFLASSFFASSTSAQCPATVFIYSETWTSFCDNNGQAIAQVSMRLIMTPGPGLSLPANADAQIGALDVTSPDAIVQTPFDQIVKNPGPGGDYTLIKKWPLANFPTRVVKRSGHINWDCSGLPYHVSFVATDGPFTIPEANCSPLAVNPSTWGAIKALYR